MEAEKKSEQKDKRQKRQKKRFILEKARAEPNCLIKL
jgi:hypothetical protein